MQNKLKLNTFLQSKAFEILVLLILGILYVPILLHWYSGWLNKTIGIEHEYFSHGVIGLPFAAYIFWEKRKQWQRLENQEHPLGMVLLIIGAIMYMTGVSEWVNISFPIILAGSCIWLKGMTGVRLMAFPLLLVTLATPNSIPYLITPYTLPLQQFIATMSGFVLMQLGFNVAVEGIYLAVNNKLVEVAPYCAGLKMLFTCIYVGLMILYWTGNIGNRTKTLMILTGSVTISITSNTLRNATLAFFHGTGQEGMFKWLHDSWGGDLLLGATLGAIVMLMKLLDWWQVGEEAEVDGKSEV